MPFKYGHGEVNNTPGDCGRLSGIYLSSSNWPKFTEELRLDYVSAQVITCSVQVPLKAYIAKFANYPVGSSEHINWVNLTNQRKQYEEMLKAGWICGALVPGNHTGGIFGGNLNNPYYMAQMILIINPILKERLDKMESEFEIEEAKKTITTITPPVIAAKPRRKRFVDKNGRIRYLTEAEMTAGVI